MPGSATTGLRKDVLHDFDADSGGRIGGNRPNDVDEAVHRQMDAGYTAVKTNVTEELHYIDSHSKVEAAVSRIAAVRDAVGPDVGIGINFHGCVHKTMAKI